MIFFSEASNDYLKKELDIDKCSKYDENRDDTCVSSNFDRNKTIDCSHYVWDRSQWQESLTTINNLVCDKDNIRRLSGTTLLLGILVGKINIIHINDVVS